jgi:hypothetical protein
MKRLANGVIIPAIYIKRMLSANAGMGIYKPNSENNAIAGIVMEMYASLLIKNLANGVIIPAIYIKKNHPANAGMEWFRKTMKIANQTVQAPVRTINTNVPVANGQVVTAGMVRCKEGTENNANRALIAVIADGHVRSRNR